MTTTMEAPPAEPDRAVDRRSVLLGAAVATAVAATLVLAFLAGRWSAPDAEPAERIVRIEPPRVDIPDMRRPDPEIRPLLGLPRDAALFGLTDLPGGFEVEDAAAERRRGDEGEQTVVLADGDDEVTITAVYGDGAGDGLDDEPAVDDGTVSWAPHDDLRIEVRGDGGEERLLEVAELVRPLA